VDGKESVGMHPVAHMYSILHEMQLRSSFYRGERIKQVIPGRRRP